MILKNDPFACTSCGERLNGSGIIFVARTGTGRVCSWACLADYADEAASRREPDDKDTFLGSPKAGS